MIIDGNSLTINNIIYNPFSPKLAYKASSPEEAEALAKLIADSGKDAKIIHDYQPAGSIPKFDGFQTDFGTAENPKAVGSIPQVVWLHAFQEDYTVDDAINNNWSASAQSNIFNGFRSGATVKSEEVVGMDKAQFLSYVRENGLDKEINWSSVSMRFIGSSEFDNFSDYTNYAGALYASLESRIMKDFAGDEQTGQLEALNQAFEEAINRTEFFYVSNVNHTFNKFGLSVPEEELKQGIRELMTAKKDAYREFVKSNSDFAGLAGSEDKWLERDMGYMANALRNAYKPEVKTECEFKESDIIAVGAMARMYLFDSYNIKLSHVLDYNDEESIGLAISMNYLMLAATLDDFNVNESLRKFGGDLFDKYAQSVIDREDRGLTLARKNPLGKQASAFAPLDKDDIYAVLNIMIKTYEETKDAEKAIYATTSFAYNQFKGKESKNEYAQLWRYGGDSYRMRGTGADFWDNLYDNGKGNCFMGKLIDKWNLFAGAINGNDLKTLSQRANTNLFHTYRGWKWLDKSISGGYSAEKGWYFD